MKLLIPACLIFLTSSNIYAQTEEREPIRPDLTGTAPICVENNSETDGEIFYRPDLSGEIYTTPINKSLAPRVFLGYRYIREHTFDTIFPERHIVEESWRKLTAATDSVIHEGGSPVALPTDSLYVMNRADLTGYIPDHARHTDFRKISSI